MRPAIFLLLLVLCFSTFSCTENAPTAPTETSAPTPQVDTPQEKVAAPAPLPKVQRAESGKLNPVDEGQLSPDFFRFRQELLAAVGRKDVRFIKQAISPQIKVDFGGEDGAEAFVKTWQLDTAPEASPLWQNLGKVLSLGGLFDRHNKDAFSAPYLATTWPDFIEPYDYVAITGEQVRVRQKPSTSAKAIAALNYDIVKRASSVEETKFEKIAGENWPWVKIVLPGKEQQQGYVYGKYVHGPVDFRAYFERENGRWRMTSFLAGD